MSTYQELLALANAGSLGARMRLAENEMMFLHAEISQRMLDAQVIILDEGRYYILEQLTDGVWWPIATDELLCMQSIICTHEIERGRARNTNACASALSDSDPS